MLRKLKWQIPGEPPAARCNWCQGPVPGRGPAIEKHCYRRHNSVITSRIKWLSPVVTINLFKGFLFAVCLIWDKVGILRRIWLLSGSKTKICLSLHKYWRKSPNICPPIPKYRDNRFFFANPNFHYPQFPTFI